MVTTPSEGKMLTPAIIVRRRTADGLCELRGDVPLGKTYLVDLACVVTAYLLHIETQQSHQKRLIRIPGEGMFPMELLSIPVLN